MYKITKCVNEWNATVEALGQGKQIILIRKYNTTLNEFLLYPTISYAYKEKYIKSFQNKYHEFVKENNLPKNEDNKNEIKYFAKVEKILEKPASRIGSFKNYYIWTSNHVRSYLSTPKAYIWILRVYKLKKPVMAERTRGIKYANVLEPILIEDIKPILNDSKFSKLVHEIENK